MSVILEPCPECDKAALVDEGGACIHCGADRSAEVEVKLAAEHEHYVLEGEDQCALCGALVCPDCGAEVEYEPADGSYGHPEPLCWLHRNSRVIGHG